MGRPSSYTPEIADKICELLADGKSLNSICKGDEFPTRATVCNWLADADRNGALSPYKEFFDKYLRARELQADTIFDECLEIADDDSLDVGFDDEGKPFVKGENIQRAKLRVDTRMRMAGKLKPKKYGDRQVTEVTGADGGAIQHTHAVRYIKPDGASS